MDKVIIIRYGELFLKGKNRGVFERLLISDIKNKLSDINCNLYFGRGRYVVSEFENSKLIIERLLHVFGLHSLSEGVRVKTDLTEITDAALSMIPSKGTFRVNTNRADKNFPMTSMQISAEIGGNILDAKSELSVDLHRPDFTVYVDLREDGTSLVYTGSIPAAGGMPAKSAGKGLLLLSGGIDSPVAGYLMAKRGVRLSALHFHSYPYTSIQAKEKVENLARILCDYVDEIELIYAPFTKIQEAIHKHCNPNYMITILRRAMMRTAERVALNRGLGCIINGESLGQVASQTMQSITVTNAVVKTVPVLRPLIGMDKQDIIDISTEIGTYETSIQPYEDCCTVFLPDSPVTKPSMKSTEIEENKIPSLEGLIDEVIENLEIVKVKIK